MTPETYWFDCMEPFFTWHPTFIQPFSMIDICHHIICYYVCIYLITTLRFTTNESIASGYIKAHLLSLAFLLLTACLCHSAFKVGIHFFPISTEPFYVPMIVLDRISRSHSLTVSREGAMIYSTMVA